MLSVAHHRCTTHRILELAARPGRRERLACRNGGYNRACSWSGGQYTGGAREREECRDPNGSSHVR